METVEKIWLDGSLIPWDEAKIHVLSHALHYGSAAFEGIRFYDTKKGPMVFRLQEHVKRLFYSAKTIKIDLPFSEDDFIYAILETIRINQLKSGYIRPIVFYGYGKMGLNPHGAKVSVAIAAWPWGAYLGKDMVNVKVVDVMRLHPKSIIADAKLSGYYINSIFASQEAEDAGYDEALLLDYNGNIAEGPGENFFMVQKNKLLTPPKGKILPGVSRDSVLKIAEFLDIKCEEKEISPEEAKKTADELFFTGTAAEIQPIGKLDNVIINKGKIGPITKKIKDCFTQIVSGKNNKFKSWLTAV